MKIPEEEWKEIEQERDELKAVRRAISKRIHLLNMRLAQRNRTKINPPDKTNTIAYQMFGKRLRDLTPDERRLYYNARQRINSKRRKQK